MDNKIVLEFNFNNLHLEIERLIRLDRKLAEQMSYELLAQLAIAEREELEDTNMFRTMVELFKPTSIREVK
jgi:hypothetical protein